MTIFLWQFPATYFELVDFSDNLKNSILLDSQSFQIRLRSFGSAQFKFKSSTIPFVMKQRKLSHRKFTLIAFIGTHWNITVSRIRFSGFPLMSIWPMWFNLANLASFWCQFRSVLSVAVSQFGFHLYLCCSKCWLQFVGNLFYFLWNVFCAMFYFAHLGFRSKAFHPFLLTATLSNSITHY